MSIPEQDVISKVPTDGVPEIFGIVLGPVGVPCPIALYDFVRGTPGYLSSLDGTAVPVILNTANHLHPE